ncbi:unnamed protein product, partial [marine sediment metagenome]
DRDEFLKNIESFFIKQYGAQKIFNHFFRNKSNSFMEAMLGREF